MNILHMQFIIFIISIFVIRDDSMAIGAVKATIRKTQSSRVHCGTLS